MCAASERFSPSSSVSEYRGLRDRASRNEGDHQAAAPMTWRPLLELTDAALAIETAAEIGDAIANRLDAAQWQGSLLGEGAGSYAHASLAYGYAGLAVLFAYLARAGVRPNKHAEFCSERASKLLAELPLSPALFTGVLGIGWAIEEVRATLESDPSDDDDTYAEIDSALAQWLADPSWAANFDLTNGVVGAGVYGLSRSRSKANESILCQVIAHLNSGCLRSTDGVYWECSGRRLFINNFDVTEAHVNLGLAHGVPGVIAFLAHARGRSSSEAIRSRLLGDAVHWLLHQRLPGKDARYPGILVRDRVPAPTRLAWCYGDLGVAHAFLAAARAEDRSDWLGAAHDAARAAALRSVDRSGVVDAGFCHGAGGVAHLFNRFWQTTDDLQCRNAALNWYRYLLAMRETASGIAGYRFWTSVGGSLAWRPSLGLLDGAAGVALSLLAAATSTEPRWDAIFLASDPCRRPNDA